MALQERQEVRAQLQQPVMTEQSQLADKQTEPTTQRRMRLRDKIRDFANGFMQGVMSYDGPTGPLL